MTKTIDELMADMPPFLQESFARFNAPKSEDNSPLSPVQGNKGALANYDADETPRPAATATAQFTGRVAPSIYADKGNSLAIWNTNGRVEVVLRDGNGYQHYGLLSPALQAEGGFAAPASEEDRAFQQTVFDAVTGPERRRWTNEDGEPYADQSDPNYRFRATCLWTNRDRSGACHPRSYLVVTWKGTGRSIYPVDALLLDGDKHRIFQMQREQGGGDRPQWKGYAR